MMRAMFAAISGLQGPPDDARRRRERHRQRQHRRLQGASAPASRTRSPSCRAAPAAPRPTLGGTERGAGRPRRPARTAIDNQMAVRRDPVDRQPVRPARSRATAGSGSPTTRPASATSYYTRAGNFTRDADGDLVTQEGYYVVGYTLDSARARPTTNADEDQHPGRTIESVTIGQDGVVTTSTRTGVVDARSRHISLAKFPNDAGPAARSAATCSAPRTTPARRRSATAGTNGLGLRSRRARSRCRTSTSPRSSRT